MKLKKLLIAIITMILILSFSTNVLAVTTSKSSKNEVSNSVKNEVSNETEETKNEVGNKVENKIKNEISNEDKADEDTSKSEESKTTSSKKKLISKDVSKADEKISYKNVLVKGNVFLAGDEVTLSSMEVDGDVMVFANKVKIIDSEIGGNVYLASGEILLENSELLSAYLCGDNIEISEDTKITRELRSIGSEIVLNGEVGRDFNGIMGNIVIGDSAKVSGKVNIKSEEKDISEKADIDDLDFERINYSNSKLDANEIFITHLIDEGIEITIILIIAIFILACLPKFVEVNSSLRLRDFFRAFLTGLLEFIVFLAISIGLCLTGYGIGYGLILFNLLFVFVVLGKAIFIISWAVRMSCTPEKISRVKAFFSTVLVALVLSFIGLISLAGSIGGAIIFVLNGVLAFTGFGSMFRVFFTSKKKMAKLADVKLGERIINMNDFREKQKEEVKPIEVKKEKVEEIKETESVEPSVQEEIKEEVKQEIKEEVQELKEEHEEEKKLEDINFEEKPSEEEKKDEENNENK